MGLCQSCSNVSRSIEVPQNGRFADLDSNLLENIFSFLTLEDLNKRISLVNRKWKIETMRIGFKNLKYIIKFLIPSVDSPDILINRRRHSPEYFRQWLLEIRSEIQMIDVKAYNVRQLNALHFQKKEMIKDVIRLLFPDTYHVNFYLLFPYDMWFQDHA